MSRLNSTNFLSRPPMPKAVSIRMLSPWRKEMHTPWRFGELHFVDHWTTEWPARQTKSMLNNWGIPEYNSFGTEEFLEF